MSFANRLAVVGDLHLAAPGTPLSYAGSPGDLAAWFGELLDQHDVVVVNGDLWDLERGRLPFSQSHELRAAREAWEPIARLERHERVVVLAGNHDAVLEREGFLRALEISVGRHRVRVEHGDAFDAPIKRVRTFASLVTWLSGRAAACGLLSIVEQMRRLESVLVGELGGDGPIERGASAMLERRSDLAALVVGHTHRPLLRPVAGGTLVNPGPCDGSALRWTTLDGARNEIANYARSNGCTRCLAHGDLARGARAVTKDA